MDSDALVVVMSPRSRMSDWVQNEIILGRRHEKPTFPLLLEGDAYPPLLHLQTEDCRDGTLPTARFISRLREHIADDDNERQPGRHAARAREYLDGHTSKVMSVAFGGPGGVKLASASLNEVNVWNTLSGARIVGIEGPMIPSWPVVFSPDGAVLATGSRNAHSVHLWNSTTGALVRNVGHHDAPIYGVAFSPDGATLATSDRMTLRVWDVASGARLFEYTASTWHGNDIIPGWPLSFSGDGTRLAFPNEGRPDATIFDVERRVVARIIKGKHRRQVRDIAFSVDGTLVATGSDDRTARVWDATNGRHKQVVNDHTMAVRSVAFSPTAPHLATGSSDRSIRVWDLESGLRVREFRGTHRGEVCDLTYSPDGRYIASAGADTTVRLWDAR
jgi:WD40 repeat protein